MCVFVWVCASACLCVCVCEWHRGVWVSDCLCRASHIKVASAPGKRFLAVWQNEEGVGPRTARKRYGRSGAAVFWVKKKKRLPGFIWPATVTNLSSLSDTHGETTSCGPHRGQPPNLPGPPLTSPSSLPPLSFN